MPDTPILLSAIVGDSRKAVKKFSRRGLSEERTPLVGEALKLLNGEIDRGVRTACDVDLVGLLVDGWSKMNEVRDYASPGKQPGSSPVRLALGKHPFGIDIDPGLTLVIPGVSRHHLNVIIAFVATIEAAVLVIDHGSICAVELGTIGLAAHLKWGKHDTPLKLKTRELRLPGRRDLNPPVVIRSAQSPH